MPTGANPAAPVATAQEGKFCVVENTTRTATTADGTGAEPKGEAKFKNLAVGLHYVTETGFGDNNIVQPAQPFYVTIPFPTKTETPGQGEDPDITDYRWNYDVVVYPKNQLADAPTKIITERPDNLIVGSNVTWKITAGIPNTKDPITQASVYDQLDSRLTLANSTLVIQPKDSDAEAITLTAGVDGDYTVVTNDETVEWQFTEAGLDNVNANKGGKIVVDFATTVTSVGTGTIANEPGTLGNGYGSKFNDEEVPGKTPSYTYWGNLQITKIDNSTTGKPLAGAEFWVTEKATTVGAACASDLGEQHVISKGTSDDSGVVKWGTDEVSPLGLWVANSNTELQSPSKDYCVYETKAPAGYTAGGVNTVTITPAGGVEVNYNVVNVQKPGPELPVTGAAGIVLLSVLGGGLLLVGVTLAVRSRRNEVA